MISTLRNVSKEKELELKTLVKTIVDTMSPEMIILFGSYARGDWVSDKYRENDVLYEYESDFDIIVLVKSEKTKRDLSLLQRTKDALDGKVITPVNIIVETIHFVNEKLLEGNYFYTDIKREGYVLFDRGVISLVDITAVDKTKRIDLAKRELEFWTKSAEAFLKDYSHNINDAEFNNAAFHLSQAAESLYFCILLVYTGYKPKSHNLDKVKSLAEDLVPELRPVFNLSTDDEIQSFELLKRAYIDARYSKSYSISITSLEFLFKKITMLKNLVIDCCDRKIKSL